MHEREQAAAAFIGLIVIGFCASVFQTSRNSYIDAQPLEEIEVKQMKRPLPGSIEWRIQKCAHLKYVPGSEISTSINTLDKYIDCRDKAFDEVMSRSDI